MSLSSLYISYPDNGPCDVWTPHMHGKVTLLFWLVQASIPHFMTSTFIFHKSFGKLAYLHKPFMQFNVLIKCHVQKCNLCLFPIPRSLLSGPRWQPHSNWGHGRTICMLWRKSINIGPSLLSSSFGHLDDSLNSNTLWIVWASLEIFSRSLQNIFET